MEYYFPILRILKASGVDYRVTGTWALKAYFPAEFQAYVLHDCDMALAPNWKNIQKTIEILEQNAWTVTVWEQPLPTNASEIFFQGKYYLRARQSNLVLDLTYESRIAWEILASSLTLFEGVPLASILHILTMKRLRAIEQGSLEAFQKFIDIFLPLNIVKSLT